MSAPQPLHHHAAPRAFSCMSCHNGKRALAVMIFQCASAVTREQDGAFDQVFAREEVP